MTIQEEIAQRYVGLCTAIAAGDAGEVVKFYTEDVQVMAPHMETLIGREAILPIFQGMMDGGGRDMHLQTLEVYEQGEEITEIGIFQLYLTDGTMADNGKFIVVWKRVDGELFIHRDIMNSNLPLAD